MRASRKVKATVRFGATVALAALLGSVVWSAISYGFRDTRKATTITDCPGMSHPYIAHFDGPVTVGTGTRQHRVARGQTYRVPCGTDNYISGAN